MRCRRGTAKGTQRLGFEPTPAKPTHAAKTGRQLQSKKLAFPVTRTRAQGGTQTERCGTEKVRGGREKWKLARSVGALRVAPRPPTPLLPGAGPFLPGAGTGFHAAQ